MVYYLTQEEIEYVRELSTQNLVEESLRGWNYKEEPVRPYSKKHLLSAWEFSSPCPSYRDIYLRKKFKIKHPVSKYQIFGFYLHKCVRKVFESARKMIYAGKKKIKEKIIDITIKEISKNLNEEKSLNKEDKEKLLEYCRILSEFESERVQVKFNEILAFSKFPSIDTLAFRAIPFVVELSLTGKILGFSQEIKVDAFGLSSLVFDLKFGKEMFRHKLQLTAYALTLEANYFIPINVGCIVYVRFRTKNKLEIEREIFSINDNLRAKLLEIRDNLQYSLEKGEPPNIPKKCYRNCLLFDICHSI